MYFLFSFFLIFIFSAHSSNPSYIDYLNKGDKYFKEFDNLNALQNYKKAYALAPGKYETLLKVTRAFNDVGEEYYLNHDRKDAKPYISKGVKHAQLLQHNFPDSSGSYIYLALCYGNMALFEGGNGKVKLAEKVRINAQKAIKMNPGNYLPYIIMGIYYREAAKLDWFEKIFAKTFFGTVPKGTFDKSIKMLKKAMELKPNAIVIAYELAKTYRAMGKTDEELKILKEIDRMPLINFRDKYLIKKSHRIIKASLN